MYNKRFFVSTNDNMIGYYLFAIVALSLNYIHSTNAGSTFTPNKQLIEDHLREEITFIRSLDELPPSLSSEKRTDTVCDVFDPNEKQHLCDKIIQHMIRYFYGDVFHSFLEPGNNPPPLPQIVDLNNPYECKTMHINDLDMEKRMLWCKSRPYFRDGKPPPNRYRTDGFFCAGSLKTKGRVFVFRLAQLTDQSVSAVGELDNVRFITGKVAGSPAIDDSPSTSSSSSSLSSSSSSSSSDFF